MDFDNRKVYGDTSITDGLVVMVVVFVIVVVVVVVVDDVVFDVVVDVVSSNPKELRILKS